jgi:hypothetical protein
MVRSNRPFDLCIDPFIDPLHRPIALTNCIGRLPWPIALAKAEHGMERSAVNGTIDVRQTASMLITEDVRS